MRRWSLALAVGAVIATGACERQSLQLVVVLTIDQMRADYVQRFGPRFEGGLARLLERGASYTEAHQDHGITLTAPGHATIAAGVSPARCGIVANNWWQRSAGRTVYSVEDRESPVLGRPAARGTSPANLLCTTLGDWLKDHSPASKVFSVAFKDRPAVVQGGTRADGVYWYDYDSGHWVTSSYYDDAYPEWVRGFNDARHPDKYFAGGWWRLLPEEEYAESREDGFDYEADGKATSFPHLFGIGEQPDPGFYKRLRYTPHADELTLDFVRELVVRDDLGKGEQPDLLFLGLSAADYIGHAYGPYSQEIQDEFLRLDRMLGEFLDFLDRRVGEGRYLVVLTSDHGVQAVPEELQRRGEAAGRVSEAEFLEWLTPELERTAQALGFEQAPSMSFIYAGVVLGPPLAAPQDMAALRRALADVLRRADFIEDAYTYEELLDEATPDRPYLESFRRVFHPDRAPDIMLRVRENVLLGWPPLGTSHGSPYRYDTHVPLLFVGPGIMPGRFERPVRAVDIAPTLAKLMGFEAPSGLDGQPLMEVLQLRQ